MGAAAGRAGVFIKANMTVLDVYTGPRGRSGGPNGPTGRHDRLGSQGLTKEAPEHPKRALPSAGALHTSQLAREVQAEVAADVA